MDFKKVATRDIKLSGIIKSPDLSDNFIERVHKFKKILSEVETTTIEQAIVNFLQDKHPEKELTIWENIASVYGNIVKTYPDLSIEEKKEIFKDILKHSMGLPVA